MRSFRYLVFCTLIAACSKKSDTSVPSAMQYNVSGVADITLYATDSLTSIIGVGYISGEHEKLTLSLSNVPANVGVTLDTASSIPPYASTMKVSTKQAARGIYPVKIIATTASNNNKTFEFNLRIIKCSDEVAGKYTADYLATKRGTHKDSISVNGDFENDMIMIIGAWNYPYFIIGGVNCFTKTIRFNKQSPPGLPNISIEGGGTYNKDSIVLYYLLNDNSISGGYEYVDLVLKK